ncbi:MAG TPA: asparagine synthase C-terminal domain-containing protein [Methylibium sp.]|nr:asparagine synthase C-terminal domain-containing protein [Methylibium sp.]
MFRYVALAWDESAATSAAMARQLSRSLHGAADWQAVLLRPGLQVFTAGAREGVNGRHGLGNGQGVVLGQVFRRGAAGVTGSTDFRFSDVDTERILRTGGRALVDDFWGRYIAFLPGACGEHTVLRDPTGALPCYQMQCHGVRIVFSWLDELLETLPALPRPTPDWDAVAACILLGRLGGRATALDGITQVLAGEQAFLGAPTEASSRLWCAVETAGRPLDIDPALAASQLRQTVRTCTQAWAGCYEAILLRLSGGLDSAILLSCLSPADTSAAITCLNYHSPGADSDEREYARLAANAARRLLIERERDRHFRLESVLGIAHTPAPESYLGRMGTGRLDAEAAAEHGATAIFTGAGGDQLFFERRCTWPAADYLQLRGPDGGFLGATLDAARLARVSFWKALKLAFADRLRRVDPFATVERRPALARREALSAIPQRKRFVHPGLLTAGSLPVGKFEQLQEVIGPFEYYDPYLRQSAPELVHPLMSQPLIELCLRLPTYALTRGGRARALARQAFAGDIPPRIAARRSKGGMEEHITAVLQRNLPFVRSLLLDGQLVGHALLDRDRLEAALSGRPSTLDAHVGEIHDLVAIEAWLQRWSGARGPGTR